LASATQEKSFIVSAMLPHALPFLPLLLLQILRTSQGGMYSSSHSSCEMGEHCYPYITAGDLKHGLIGNMSNLIVEVSKTEGI